MKSAVGIVGMSIADFYLSEPRQINIILEGYEIKQEQEYKLNQIAIYNGTNAGRKGFKEIKPFDKKAETHAVSAKTTKEMKENTLHFLSEKFNKVGDNMK